MPDGRLKSIILPTEMCFPEHYIKPQSSVQGVRAEEESHLLDGTVATLKSQLPTAERHEEKIVERLHAMLRFLWRGY